MKHFKSVLASGKMKPWGIILIFLGFAKAYDWLTNCELRIVKVNFCVVYDITSDFCQPNNISGCNVKVVHTFRKTDCVLYENCREEITTVAPSTPANEIILNEVKLKCVFNIF